MLLSGLPVVGYVFMHASTAGVRVVWRHHELAPLPGLLKHEF